MDRFFGLIGIVFILGIAFLMSNNKKAINLRTVLVGLGLQLFLAVFILKTSLGKAIFEGIGYFIKKLLDFSDDGGRFVFGFLADKPDLLTSIFGSSFIFAIKIIPTIIFIVVLVNIFYHLGIMQRVIAVIAKLMYKIMGVSGAEALSNVASAFVGQVEAQIMIKPYVAGMTRSELLASMSGSMACIAGGVMAIYISMGVPAEYLLAASIMAAPGALVISKIVYPETEKSETKGEVKLKVEKTYVNLIDAISHGASDGMRISLSIIAMLIGLIALIAMIDWIFGFAGRLVVNWFHISSFLGLDFAHLSLREILGAIFSVFAYLMGVPFKEAASVGGLMGTKLVLNEFVAYIDLLAMNSSGLLSQKSIVIASFALCGFANLGSIAIQVGGIGEIAPNRKKDLAVLGVRALICGTLASYLSAAIAGILVG